MTVPAPRRRSPLNLGVGALLTVVAVTLLPLCSKPSGDSPDETAATTPPDATPADEPAKMQERPAKAGGPDRPRIYATYLMEDEVREVTIEEYERWKKNLGIYYSAFVLTKSLDDASLWIHYMKNQEAKEFGIVATDKDVRDHLVYMSGGELDEDYYNQVLEVQQMDRGVFEEVVRDVVRGEKLMEYFEDTARTIDPTVFEQFVRRHTEFTLTYTPFSYVDYLEGAMPELPEIRHPGLLDQEIALVDNDLRQIAKGKDQKDGNEREIELLEERKAQLEQDRQALEKAKAMEDAAFQKAKIASNEVKEEILDLTVRKLPDIVEPIRAQIPQQIEDDLEKIRKQRPDDPDFEVPPERRELVERTVRNMTERKVRYAIRPYSEDIYDEVVARRKLPAYDLTYKVDWDRVDGRDFPIRRIGHVPTQEDYELFVKTNVTITRAVVGMLAGAFPDEPTQTSYLLLMRKIDPPEPNEIDPITYLKLRHMDRELRKNQMTAFFSTFSIIIRHNVKVEQDTQFMNSPMAVQRGSTDVPIGENGQDGEDGDE